MNLYGKFMAIIFLVGHVLVILKHCALVMLLNSGEASYFKRNQIAQGVWIELFGLLHELCDSVVCPEFQLLMKTIERVSME